jgi:hypothetical protein
MDFESLAQSGSNFDDFCKFNDGISISAIFVELRSTNYQVKKMGEHFLVTSA